MSMGQPSKTYKNIHLQVAVIPSVSHTISYKIPPTIECNNIYNVQQITLKHKYNDTPGLQVPGLRQAHSVCDGVYMFASAQLNSRISWENNIRSNLKNQLHQVYLLKSIHTTKKITNKTRENFICL